MLGFIVEIIGEEAAAKLIANFGGTRLYVPHSPCADDALARAVGTGAAMKLAEMFGGERVELPKPPPRRTQILALRAAGRSVEEIARALELHAPARIPGAGRGAPRGLRRRRLHLNPQADESRARRFSTADSDLRASLFASASHGDKRAHALAAARGGFSRLTRTKPAQRSDSPRLLEVA